MSNSPLERYFPLFERYGIRLEPEQESKIAAFADLILHWNSRINLTGARDRDTLMRRHLADCLMLEAVPRPPDLRQWLDIGSGAGLPGVILALMHPEYRVTAVESVSKKATFQREAARTLGLANHEVLREDVARLAENPPQGRWDAAVARAFAPLKRLLPLGRGLIRHGGQFWAMKGELWKTELEQVEPSVRALYRPEPQVFTYRLEENGKEGVVLVFTRRSGREN